MSRVFPQIIDIDIAPDAKATDRVLSCAVVGDMTCE